MPYIELHSQEGTAEGLSSFYTVFFHASTRVQKDNETSQCIVDISSGQELRFIEREDAPSRRDYDEREERAYHICIYVEDFKEAYERCASQDLIWENPRFPADSATTWEEAKKQQQFRVREVVEPGSGDLLMLLEHEVRGLAHPCCPLAPKA